jgi:HEAT repeat protein
VTSRLASLLVQEGLVAPKQMADAFQRQVIYGGTLDTILLEMNAVAEGALVGALSRATSLPPGDTPSIERLKHADALTWLPAALAEKFRVVPIDVDGKTVRVLTIDPPDRRALDELGLQIGRAVEATIVPEHRFVLASSLVYDTVIPARFQSLQARLLRRAQQGGPPAPSPAPARTPPPPTPTASAPTPPAPAPSAPAASPFPTPSADRPVVTDLPMPGAPTTAHDHMQTPRLTTREVAAPAPIAREVVRPQAIASASVSTDATPLGLDQAIAAIDAASDRDEIFAALCRGARSRADYAALFTVHAETMVGRVALADAWIDRSTLASLSVSLDAPTPFRTAVLSRAPLVGKVGEEPVSRNLLESLGRRAPMLAALLPIVLRDRTVALLYADVGGKALAKEAMGELSNGTGAAARAFQRLILAAKGQDYKAAASGAGGKIDLKAAGAKAGALGAVVEGAWRTGGDGAGRVVDDVATARHAAPAVDDPVPLFASVERGDDKARESADRLIALGARGAEMAVERLPGPIRIDRTSYRGLTPPLADHGPICGLVARFGSLAVPALERRVGEGSADVRFYATLALGELAHEAALPLLQQRLFDRDAGVRKAATDAIVRMPSSAPRTTLIESLRGELPGPERDRQRTAAETLGALGDAASVPRLIELVKHEDHGVQDSARKSLLAITKQDYGTSRWRWRGWWDRHKNEPREEWLFEGLGHGDEGVRASAAEELKRLYTEHFGYHWDAPKREREEARKRWLDWYRARK